MDTHPDASETPQDVSRRSRWTRAGAIAVGLIFLFRSVIFLYRAHPQDDAYILFGFVKRFVAGEGIVFYPGGPHAEGATDFLWFALLSILHRLGLDIAIAACLLNAAGGAVLGGMIAGAIAGPSAARSPSGVASSSSGVASSSSGRASSSRLALLGLLAPAALAGGAIAAAVGFGSLFYSAAAAWTLALAVAALEGGSAASSAIARIPFAGLLLALIRPDGVVLGAGFALIGGLAAARQRRLRPFAWRALVAAALGGAYFVWRWMYFGLPLPLPLYVKGHAARELSAAAILEDPSAILAGAGSIRGWLLHPVGGWPILLAFLTVIAIAGRSRGRGPRLSTLALAGAPFLAHLAILSLARQSQNAAFRFEAPAQTALLFLLVLGAVRAMESRTSTSIRFLIALVALAGAAPGVVVGTRLLTSYESLRTYVDAFGPRLGEILEPEDRVALGDQAGRIPYWSRARMFDLVGLNTERTAIAPPDAAYLAGLDPDLFLLYTGPTTFDLEKWLPDAQGEIVPLGTDALKKSVRPEQRVLFEQGITEYGSTSIPDSACNLIAAKYLADSGRYDLYAVRYMGSFKHVYALKHGHPRAPAILDALRTSLRPEAYRSYAQEAGLPFAAR